MFVQEHIPVTPSGPTSLSSVRPAANVHWTFGPASPSWMMLRMQTLQPLLRHMGIDLGSR